MRVHIFEKHRANAQDFSIMLPVAVAVMLLCKQVGRFDGINTAVTVTLDVEAAKTQLIFSMSMVAGLVVGHWLT